jgi:DNA invertase Pin-like site-specific DNA recombinase
MAALLAVFAEFDREILRERVRAGLAHARRNRTKVGRPITAATKTGEVRLGTLCPGVNDGPVALPL